MQCSKPIDDLREEVMLEGRAHGRENTDVNRDVSRAVASDGAGKKLSVKRKPDVGQAKKILSKVQDAVPAASPIVAPEAGTPTSSLRCAPNDHNYFAMAL